MDKLIDLTGKTFGRLKVLYRGDDYITPKGQHKPTWWCECSCGNPNLINVTGTHLRSGHTTSCGCYNIQTTIEANSKTNVYDLTGEYGIGYTTNTNVPFLFDLEDFDKIKQFCWREDNSKNGYIVARDITQPHETKIVLLHRIIMNCPDEMQVDHIFHDVKDNRKSKMRIVTLAQNNYNRLPYEGEKIRGVYPKKNGKWKAQITFKGVVHNLGLYNSKGEAVTARKEGEKKYFGEYAYQEEMLGQED